MMKKMKMLGTVERLSVNYVTEGRDGMKKDGKIKGERKQGLGSLHMNYRLAVFSPSRRLAGEPTF
jgi:hypothetical protein